METVAYFNTLHSLPSKSSGCKRRDSLDPRRIAYNACKEYLNGPWTQLSFDEFLCSELGGGLTNRLYTCILPMNNNSNSNDHPTSVLMRLYGLIRKDYKAQIQESVVFSILAERRIGPQLYAVFPGGRLEQFIPNSRTLVTEDLYDPSISMQTAQRVAEYHGLVMPVKKDPTFIMSKLTKYYEKVFINPFTDDRKKQLFDEFIRYDIPNEINFLRGMVERMEAVVVFCHNDLQEGNASIITRLGCAQDFPIVLLNKEAYIRESRHSLLYFKRINSQVLLSRGNLLYCYDDSRTNKIQLIDFEYSSYNYRGFDIANHFCEWTYDYVSNKSWPYFTSIPEKFPNEEQQRLFVGSYLKAIYELFPSREKDLKWSIDFVMNEVNRLVLMSHLFWAMWSVRQAQISDISFGYMEYALSRMSAYFKHKERLQA